MTTPPSKAQYDIIFAGGGTSACVTAGRLAKANPTLSILIIERGKNHLVDPDPLISTPALYAANYKPGSKNVIVYPADPEASLHNRTDVEILTGGVLGGGSAVNAMMYSRPLKGDLDGFEVEGWDYEGLFAYAKKIETFLVDDDEGIDSSVHGTTGPVEITHGTHVADAVRKDLLDAAEAMGYGCVRDLQDFSAGNGFSRSGKYIGRNGERQDAASCYLRPVMEDGKGNLEVLCGMRVCKVVFEGARAVGIEYVPEAEGGFVREKESGKGVLAIVKARKLVVVSAGALGSPSILERSGIGNKALLEEMNIPLVSESPGVGENYQDHHFVRAIYKTNLTQDQTLDALATGRVNVPHALATHDPLLGWNGIDVVGKIRMTDDEAAALGPDFKNAWDQDYARDPTKPIQLVTAINAFVASPHTHREAERLGLRDGKQYVTLASYTPYPYSRGSVHIRSGDAHVAPRLVTGFLSDERGLDVKMAGWMYKVNREIYRRTDAFAGELGVGHPGFREGSGAALEAGPIRRSLFGSVEERKSVPRLEYDEEDDGAIEKWVRERVVTMWHGLGTCKMGEREGGGVVDKDLSVYGTKGLKVVDLSIIPKNIGANTNWMAMVVGEKAADVIAGELGIAV